MLWTKRAFGIGLKHSLYKNSFFFIISVIKEGAKAENALFFKLQDLSKVRDMVCL